MVTIRFKALEEVMNRQPKEVLFPEGRVSGYFASNVFGKEAMREYMSEEAYNSVIEAIEKSTNIDRKIADQVAASMKAWASERGATHYTHWFQPLTGETAEKHDAFFEPTESGRAIERFGGGSLVQQEPDASSFPSGGIRNTFEARGYTAWDPSSPAFLMGKTLCIPTIFVSYTGEALDYKTPLLKALHVLDKNATEVCQYFDKNVTKVTTTLGWEQEYFLVDSALYNARPDLALTGRALFGHAPAKGQQLEDHYFGSIPDRVAAFMREYEIEAHMLGIPVKTRHNEVAPNQYECAPIFEECNLAVDHNQLLMELMKKVAKKHNFRILFHEKPFAKVNGSGKHCNWSLSTNTGKNLLAPGKTPKNNLQFLTFFVNSIVAFHNNADLLRATIASAGNDHRLGANEAPPAIMSVFIGSQLTAVLDELEKKVKSGKMSPDEKTALKLGIGRIPEILLDNTDRNRTSPFAFTGNKFEFRAVGSSANTAAPMIALNTAMADQLAKFKKQVDELIGKGVDKDEAIFQILRKCIVDSKKIRFEGNGYGEEWVAEAKKRGLSNIKDTPRALEVYIHKESIELFKRMNVFNEREMHARHEIRLEGYTKKIQIESRVMGDLVLNHILPVALKYQSEIVNNIKGLKEVLSPSDFNKMSVIQLDMVKKIAVHIEVIKKSVDQMTEERKKANKLSSQKEMALAYRDKVFPFFETIRYHVDKLELIVDDAYWPLPKFRELLFTN
ncbi:MAG: glutamine synthetase type III [Bacteroidetes bacterium]|nr:glutamine synthetase type III [Bacteroidota bacterium]MBV6461905.1 Glutamine synthetase [Flavobacteriales bacterium]WKZ74475.1 MAG: glutamine synthetase III [Vicingaceae bacterium]NOG95089.1 glutamine synthetase type III [Bacteroidota bacterium]CAG0953289.1 glutamine synthetase [Flavobacteriales bacterium]